MSAVILPFPAERANPRFITTDFERAEMDKRFRQARLIREAERSVPLALWLAFLTFMDKAELAKMEALLAVRGLNGEPDIEQALAVVQFAGASGEQRREIKDLMDRLAGQAVQS